MIENDLEVFSIRVPKTLGGEVRKLAEQSRRSRNSQLILLLEQAMDLHKSRMTRAEREAFTTLKA